MQANFPRLRDLPSSPNSSIQRAFHFPPSFTWASYLPTSVRNQNWPQYRLRQTRNYRSPIKVATTTACRFLRDWVWTRNPMRILRDFKPGIAPCCVWLIMQKISLRSCFSFDCSTCFSCRSVGLESLLVVIPCLLIRWFSSCINGVPWFSTWLVKISQARVLWRISLTPSQRLLLPHSSHSSLSWSAQYPHWPWPPPSNCPLVPTHTTLSPVHTFWPQRPTFPASHKSPPSYKNSLHLWHHEYPPFSQNKLSHDCTGSVTCNTCPSWSNSWMLQESLHRKWTQCGLSKLCKIRWVAGSKSEKCWPLRWLATAFCAKIILSFS